MYTKPTISDLIRAVMISLNKDIAPDLTSSRSKVAVLMAQTLLQSAIQRLDADPGIVAAEHNEMTALYRSLAATLGDQQGEAAERVRQRATTLGALPDVPAPYPAAELMDLHRKLSEGLIGTLDDLDGMLRAGQESTRAQAALEQLRGHLMIRTAREFQTQMVNPGSLAGRD